MRPASLRWPVMGWHGPEQGMATVQHLQLKPAGALASAEDQPDSLAGSVSLTAAAGRIQHPLDARSSPVQVQCCVLLHSGRLSD